MINKRWKVLKQSYKDRLKIMSRYIKEGEYVLDLGAGNLELVQFLPKKCNYDHVDLVKRNDKTILCDFNNNEYPPIKKYSTVICSGILEYLYCLEKFISRVCEYSDKIIISYAIYNDHLNDRIISGWVNNYTEDELETIFAKNNLVIKNKQKWGQQNIYHLEKVKYDYTDIGAICVNFFRPKETIKCISTLKKYAPGIKIYVGDQDKNNTELKTYCKKNNINHIPLKFDCGIGVGRNILIKHAKKDKMKFIFWGDNDFVYDHRFKLYHAKNVLSKVDNIGVVGGSLFKNNVLQHYERFLYYNKQQRMVISIPIEFTYTKSKILSGIPYYLCDMTFNFCLAKTEIFNNDVKWSENIKVRFEHNYFFIKLKEHSEYKVAYCPSMQTIHEHNPGNNSYNKYRNRDSDYNAYSKELELDTLIELGSDSCWNFVEKKVVPLKYMKRNYFKNKEI